MEVRIDLDNVFPYEDETLSFAIREAIVEEVGKAVRKMVREQIAKQSGALVKRMEDEIAKAVANQIGLR